MNDEVRITLRLPASLRDALLSSAERTNRSMNAEIISRLSQTLDDGTDVAGLLRLALSKIEKESM